MTDELDGEAPLFDVRETDGQILISVRGGSTLNDTPRGTPPVLTAPEVADLTGWDVSSICRWARIGIVPSIRKLPGAHGAWLFDPSVVELIRPK